MALITGPCYYVFVLFFDTFSIITDCDDAKAHYFKTLIPNLIKFQA